MKSGKKNIRRRLVILWISLTVIIFPVFTAGMLLVYRGYRRIIIRNETRITGPMGVEILKRVNLGGLDQWILIRGEDRTNPVLLWLHGGPGSPTMPLASRHDTKLVKYFTVVHWDQRGAGKSFYPDIPVSTMAADRFVSDTYELTRKLKKQFGVPKIFLIGHSWGSQIGMLTVSRHPEEFYAFTAVGQFIHAPEADALGYRFALARAEQTGNGNALKNLRAIGMPPWTTAAQRAVSARWINAFGGTGRAYTSGDYFRDMATSPDYTLRDVFAYIRGMQFSGTSMLEGGDLNRINLFEMVRKVELPVYFFQGRFDYNTPGVIAEDYFEMLEAPEKSFIWFEESAHFPQWEEPENFAEEMKKVRNETMQANDLLLRKETDK